MENTFSRTTYLARGYQRKVSVMSTEDDRVELATKCLDGRVSGGKRQRKGTTVRSQGSHGHGLSGRLARGIWT